MGGQVLEGFRNKGVNEACDPVNGWRALQEWLRADGSHGRPYGCAKAKGNSGKVLFNRVVTELANNIVARRLTVRDLHLEIGRAHV